MMKKALIAATSVLVLAACDSGKSGGAGDGSGKGDGKGKTESTASAEEIPVEEDFEEEAEKKITEDNLEEQVSALEKEIEGDG